jgi:transposase
MSLLCPMPGCRVESVIDDRPGGILIHARGRARSGRCPDCRRPSRSVHSRYRRRLADLPSFAATTSVSLQLRRFYCRNTSCPRRTFAEPLPNLVRPHARRTCRLSEAQSRVGIALGGEGGARLLAHLAMPASAATVLRLVKALPMPAPDTPRSIGVDDWAMRKRCTYGTIIVDLEGRRVVDLLPDRSAATLAGWLRRRPGIATVARDRSSEYARGASLGAPEAVQVADRWHLLANVRQVVERWLHTAQTRLRHLPSPSAGSSQDAPVPPRRVRAFPRTASDRAAGTASRARWKAVYDEVRRRHASGEPLLAIARATGLARATVRKYAKAERFPARTAYGPRPSLLDPHVPHLEQRLAEGCENAMALWRELRERGFAGTSRQVHRFVAERRTKPVKGGRTVVRPAAVEPEPEEARLPLPTARQLAWRLVQPVSTLDAASAASVAHVEQDEEARTVARLARRFTALVRACGVSRERGTREAVADLDGWLTEAKGCGVSAVATFAAGLESDGAATRAALTTAWSSGQAEGQINRLKLIKRQSYGRAGLDLLRRRMILAA